MPIELSDADVGLAPGRELSDADVGLGPQRELSDVDVGLIKPEASPVRGFIKAGVAGAGNLLKGAATEFEEMPSGGFEGMENMPPAEIERYTQRAEARATRTPGQVLQEARANPVYKAGEALTQAAPYVGPESFSPVAPQISPPLSPAEQASKWTQAGESVAGFLPAAAGPAAPLAMQAQAVGEHVSADFDAAKARGADDETAAQEALDKATMSGAIQGGIFAVMPPVLRGALEKYVVDKFGTTASAHWLLGRAAAGTEGATLGASSTAGENLVEGQPVLQGVGKGAAGLATINLLLPWLRERSVQSPESNVQGPEGEAPAGGTSAPPEPGPGPDRPRLIENLLAEAGTQPAGVPEMDVREMLEQMRKNQIEPQPEQPLSISAASNEAAKMDMLGEAEPELTDADVGLEPERIVAAAIRMPNGEIRTGRMHPLIEGFDGAAPEDMGFVTNTGRFVSREEANAIAGAEVVNGKEFQEGVGRFVPQEDQAAVAGTHAGDYPFSRDPEAYQKGILESLPPALTPDAAGETKTLAAPETQTGPTAGPETLETPITSTAAQRGALSEPGAMATGEGLIPVEGGSNPPRSAAAPRTGHGSVTNARGWDLIDEVEGAVGKINPALIKEANPDFKPVGAARKIFSPDGVNAADAAKTLASSGMFKGDTNQPDQLGEALNEAARSRIGNRQGAALESKRLRQDSAFERDRDRPGANQVTKIAEDLQVGDTLKVRGAPFKVKSLEFDGDGRVTSVTLDDGEKYGTQIVDGNTELQVDSRTYRRGREGVVTDTREDGSGRTRLAQPTEQGHAPAKDALEAWADEVLKGGAVHAGPEVIAAYAVKGAYVVARIARQVALSFEHWSNQMLEEFGAKIGPHLRQIWPEALRLREEQLGQSLPQAIDEATRKSIERELAEVQAERAKVQGPKSKVQGPEAETGPTAGRQDAGAPRAEAPREPLEARRAEVSARMGELNAKASRPGGLDPKEKSERYHLARESLQIQRQLAQDPDYVADLLRRQDALFKQAEQARAAGNGLGFREAMEQARGIMEGDLQQVPPDLLSRVYNELVARKEIMAPESGEIPTGRTLGELVSYLKAKNVDSPKLGWSERFQLARRLADEFYRGKDLLTRTWGRMQALWEAFKDQYRAPAHDDDFQRVRKEWFLQKQWTGLETERWLREIHQKISNPVRRGGVTVWLQAHGDDNLLRSQADLVPERFKPYWEAALKLTADEKDVARRIELEFDQKLEDAKNLGLLDKGREDYGTPLVWRTKPKNEGEYDPEASRGGPPRTPRRPGAKLDPRDPFFALERTTPSYFDGIMNEGVPKSFDVADHVALYNSEFHNALADRGVIKALKDAKDPEGNPIVMIAGGTRIAPGEGPKRTFFVDSNWRPKKAVTKDGRPYVTVDHWALRDWKFASKDAAGNPIIVRGDFLVHPDYARFLKNELGQSAFRTRDANGNYEHPILAGALNAMSFLKASKFASATFHMATIGEHAMFHAVLPLSRGVELDPARNPTLARLMRNGMDLGFGHQRELFEDGLSSHGGIFKHVPGLGDLLARQSDFLFKRYIPAMKAKVGEAILQRNLARYSGKLSEDQIYDLTASQVNAAFGIQGWHMMGKNKTLLDVSRLMFTAPDFLLSRSKVVAQALKPFNAEQRIFLLAQGAAVYLAARALNQLLDDDPHWEPANALSVVYHGRAYWARFLVNDLWHLANDQSSFAQGRLGPLPRSMYEAVSQRDMRTGARISVPFETSVGALRSAEVLAKDLAMWFVPVGTEGLLPGAAGRDQTGMGQVGLALVGVGSRKYTPATQVYNWAADFNRNSQDQSAQLYQRDRDAEARGESAYRKLDNLLDAGDQAEARKEYEALLEEGRKPGAIAQHFNAVSRPFTGSAQREAAFYQGLDDEQKAMYRRAVQERRDRQAAFLQMARGVRQPVMAGE